MLAPDPAAAPGSPHEDAILHADQSSFESEVLRSNLPVVVDFWAAWCAPCQFLGQALETVAPGFVGRLRVVKVNVDESPGLAERYRVMSIPTLIFFDGGRDVAESTGGMGALALHDLFERFLAERGEVAS
jgi:thioredoxin 1